MRWRDVAAGWIGAVGCCAAAWAASPPPPGQMWIQVASGPTREVAIERARSFAGAFPGARTFLADTGWYAVVIGHEPESGARAQMRRLKAAGRIPGDSFVTRGESYVLQVWSAAEGAGSGRVASDFEDVFDPETLRAIQADLIWTGQYRTRADGIFGRATSHAITAWQASSGEDATGLLTRTQRARLRREAAAAIETAGFASHDFVQAGLRIGVATKLFSYLERIDIGLVFEGRRGDGASLLLISTANGREDLEIIYRAFRDDPDNVVTYERLRPDWTVVAFSDGPIDGYVYARTDGATTKGFLLVWPARETKIYGPLTTAMFDSFEPRSHVALAPGVEDRTALSLRAAPRAVAAPAAPPAPQAGGESRGATGTGFFVSRRGEVLTNAHVVEGCASVTVDGATARVVARDEEIDLALIRRDDSRPPEAIARFASRPVQLNADVTVVGYPLQGLLTGVNVTRGSVSSLSGLGGSRAHFQLTAAIQPGNSGGPVIGQGGEIVGVVVAKLDAIAVASMTGTLSENINFAIRGEVAAGFLTAHYVDYETAAPAPTSPIDLARDASLYTVLVECER